ncbi:hypothetical protein FCL47_24105 [Desulfopila sp. IMCC35006]|uniref:hypothetical protein n=1 Tax=Desulfopila sp. IMCC35006 TaxID=2569542 RepID=UPI0010AD1586|nr:hypothetical protein [Desulfopila sp. IMCC35006]TKB23032.1 hypothetical protein FCL47_24105 [Desulfopila sp. IMCC35006]
MCDDKKSISSIQLFTLKCPGLLTYLPLKKKQKINMQLDYKQRAFVWGVFGIGGIAGQEENQLLSHFNKSLHIKRSFK